MYGYETTETSVVRPRPDVVFSEVFRATYPDILAFVRRRVDPALVEDLAAEVFTIAWDRWESVPREVRPWLFGVARNLVANDHRAQERRRRLELRLGSERDPDPDDTSFSVAALDLRSAWAQLHDADREVIALVAWDGLTGREAAAVLGCTRAAFSVRLTRARRRLKRLLGTSVDEPAPAFTTNLTPVFKGELP